MATINVSGSMLNGAKTYLVALGTMAFAGLSYWHGTMDMNAAVQMALGGAGLGALRHGISTAAVAKAEAIASAAVAAYNASKPSV